jgi:hypothetical protein
MGVLPPFLTFAKASVSAVVSMTGRRNTSWLLFERFVFTSFSAFYSGSDNEKMSHPESKKPFQIVRKECRILFSPGNLLNRFLSSLLDKYII